MSNLLYLAILALVVYTFPTCLTHTLVCERRKDMSGVIHGSVQKRHDEITTCWSIEVPTGSYVRLDIKELQFSNYPCSNNYVKIYVVGTNETYTYCSQDVYWKPVTALSDVNITYYHYGGSNYRSTSFRMNYVIEDLVCAQKNHFRCSNSSCIHQYKVCDGVKDCQNGTDEIGCETGITGVRGVNISLENTLTWLKSQRSTSFGWGKNTHRAITALYLAGAADFNGKNLEEELMVKQLELQTSVALLRNSTDPVSVSELSMLVNALTVTCHSPRQFYGHDLLQILAEQVSNLHSPSPSAYLTLCNLNWTITATDVIRLMKPLHTSSKYPFILDVQAVSHMALTCIKNRTKGFKNISNADNIYEKTIKSFIDGQLSDGSFGNVYTTALVTQALISSGQKNNKQWNVTATAQFLMRQLNSSSIDFLSAYLTLPVFKDRSIVNVGDVTCSNATRKQGEDNEISDITNKLSGKIRVQYSLFVGDRKDVIHTIFLRMPENSSAYDVMRVAQVADPKYKFCHRDVSGHMYIYEIAGITNDPEAGKFWLLYTGDNHHVNGTVKHYITSPDEFTLKDNEHLIMWYKTATI